MDPHKKWTPEEPNTPPNFSNRRMNSGADNMYAEQEHPDNLNNQNTTDNQNTQSEQNDRQPQYAGAYTVIPPNESRRSKLQRMAQQEEQDLQRWKEEHRPGPIQLPPSQLGGSVSLDEARKKQFLQAKQSKLQKKLKQEEMDRIRREEEEKKYELMKTTQREKTIKLEQKSKEEDVRRRFQYEQDRQAKTAEFLQRVGGSSLAPTATSSAPPTSSWVRGKEYREAQRQEENDLLLQKREEQRRKGEHLEEKQRRLEEERQRETKMDHRRVNSAFLDRIEGRASSALEAEPAPATPEDCCGLQVPGPTLGATLSSGATLTPDLADGTEEAGSDRDWVVMKLINDFPFCERDFLEDIVDQCDGDYQRAYSLLQ
ncbi:epithelial-stromal interaction protein 1 [Anguilla anguilla]|uniref:epithelial-stromal interaction protein 1 n=1 Tax=Anguilla anguilla TaxID=7936 RepID=UPI0015AD7CCC|nr:epithelial-stromal interaction protein 1 [Anguilla anguilla]